MPVVDRRFVTHDENYHYYTLFVLQDLVGAEPEKRNWKGIALALLTICLVFSLVGLAVIVLTPEPIKTGSVDLILDHIPDQNLQPVRKQLQWLSG